ncbi:MAG: hypothetical protein DRI61_06140 [Chloroflexi bacterium]|nr:MAG: hypothetical protein DRI61_06140 [Chloroflexota bacterium]
MSQREWKEVDIELLAFIERVGSSLVKLDLLDFFARNPYTRDTSANIALRIGRDKEAVALELYDLYLMGFLERERLNNTFVYRLSPDKKTREMATKAIRKLNALK